MRSYEPCMCGAEDCPRCYPGCLEPCDWCGYALAYCECPVCLHCREAVREVCITCERCEAHCTCCEECGRAGGGSLVGTCEACDGQG